jgi:hypothetical protein
MADAVRVVVAAAGEKKSGDWTADLADDGAEPRGGSALPRTGAGPPEPVWLVPV